MKQFSRILAKINHPNRQVVGTTLVLLKALKVVNASEKGDCSNFYSVDDFSFIRHEFLQSPAFTGLFKRYSVLGGGLLFS